ncbi:MAG: TonB-dependent receptor [Gammaproteobacteria bacterium]|nr:TonB-dependent receptor [Gammaproteobacteria bacterium]
MGRWGLGPDPERSEGFGGVGKLSDLLTSANAVAAAGLVALTMLVGQTASAANGNPASDSRALEEIVVTGTRTRERSIAESMSPVDAIAGAQVAEQGETNLDMLLRNVVPSFNISATTGDAAVLVRPANLRGLAPDHTLVLVNGRRRHRGAVILWSRIGVSHGAQGPDLSSIPSIALRQVEVLRDGASAQYGSDAIAGVMNFLLKEDRSGGALQAYSGAYAEGDGESFAVAGNVGLPWGEGFVNLSAEYGSAQATNRNIQRADAELLIAAGNTHVANPAQRWGAPDVDDDLKLMANFGRPVGPGAAEFYGHANYAARDVGSRSFFFRNPNTRDAVFSADGGATLLIGDALDATDGVNDGSANCPVVTVTAGRPEPTALARVLADPNCFSFQELFPGGFQPLFGGKRTDASVLAGVRGETVAGTIWDLSLSAGANEADFLLVDSVNASLGPATPTSFEPGSYRQRETNANFDLTRSIGRHMHLAGGLEWRNEGFEIGLGETDSWRIGPYATQGFSSGSNGFPGFSPIAAGDWNRANAAAYGDVEYSATDRAWTVGGALRFERYDDFGATWNGKFAGRREVTAGFALRGSVSTGFRAPTPGQQNAFNVSTQWDPNLLELVNNGTIPSTSRVAALRGGEALDAEKSRNLAAGVVLERGSLLIAFDIFRIDLENRLGVTGLFALAQDEVDALLAEGITSAANLANFRFFANDFETRTHGVDVVGSWRPAQWSGRTSFDFALNLTRTKVGQYNPLTLDARRIRELRDALPGLRWNATGRHEWASMELLARLRYFDGWWDPRDDWAYGNAYLLDLEVALQFTPRTRLALGARNALNKTADQNPNPERIGNLYSTRAPFDVNGAFYYARLTHRWND